MVKGFEIHHAYAGALQLRDRSYESTRNGWKWTANSIRSNGSAVMSFLSAVRGHLPVVPDDADGDVLDAQRCDLFPGERNQASLFFPWLRCQDDLLE